MEIMIRKLFISLVILSALTSEGVSIPSLWWYAVLPGNEQVDTSAIIRRDVGVRPEETWKGKRVFSNAFRKSKPDENRSWPGNGTFLAAGPSCQLDFNADCRPLQASGAESSPGSRQMTVYQADSSPPGDQGSNGTEYRI